MTQTTNMRGIGYFDTLFSAVEMSTMAEALKQFALDHQVTEKSNQGEVLNDFVSILIKTLDVEDFQAISTQFLATLNGIEECLKLRRLNLLRKS